MRNYVYIESERWRDGPVIRHLYTVGYYAPSGKFIPESDHSTKEEAAERVAYLNGSGFDFCGFIRRQHEFSQCTFGPGERVDGIIKHIEKELADAKAKPNDISEWCDIIILAIDGALRQNYSAPEIAKALANKLTKNESRNWPNWRSVPESEPIEHVRDGRAE